ncbi:hypothetical protein B0H34DRAFT_799902 [Crassisporium funariophilum]|nr:hypothetical protein B0H34DRAFT_799902 [Crassisporium funariophilum]
MDITTLVSQGTAVNLVSAACLTVLVYDHAITLDQEVTRMWPARFSIAKFLFFMNRYPVEAMLLFNCVAAAQPYQSPSLFVLLYSFATTTLETFPMTVVYFTYGGLPSHPLYQQVLSKIGETRSALIPPSILCDETLMGFGVWCSGQYGLLSSSTSSGASSSGGTMTLISLVIKDYVDEEVLINTTLASLPGCYATSVPSIIAGFWIGPLIVESVLFLLVISRALVWWRDGAAAPRIFAILARDSTVYFVVVFALLLANYLVFQFGPPFLSSLLVTPSTTAGCILGSHMLLNLRAMAEPTPEDLMTTKPEAHMIPMHSRRSGLSKAGPGLAALPSPSSPKAKFALGSYPYPSFPAHDTVSEGYGDSPDASRISRQ